MRATASRLSALPRELTLLLAVAAVLSCAWAVATAPLQGPDESGHYAYAQHLAETGRGPSPDELGHNVSTELDDALTLLNLRPTVGRLGALPAVTELEERRWTAREDALTDAQLADGVGPSPLARNPQLYYAYEAIPYRVFRGAGLFSRLMAMRLANGALFVVTVLLTWLLAVELFGAAARLRVMVATAVVALWPMLTFMAGVINPDTGLVTAYTALALAATRLVVRGPSLGRVAATGVAAAACLLVHGRGVAALGVALVAFVVACARSRPGALRSLRWAGAGLVAVAVPLALSRVVLAPGSAKDGFYGGEVNIPTQVFSVKDLVYQTWQFYFDRLSFMHDKRGPQDYGYRQVVVERFVTGLFGSLEIGYPAWVYGAVQLGIAGFVVAAWTAAVLTRERVRRAWPVLLTLGSLALGTLALLHVASYRALTTGDDPLITGRYLLPLVPVIAVLVAWLVGVLPGAWRHRAAGALVCVLLLLQLGGLGLTAVRFGV